MITVAEGGEEPALRLLAIVLMRVRAEEARIEPHLRRVAQHLLNLRTEVGKPPARARRFPGDDLRRLDEPLKALLALLQRLLGLRPLRRLPREIVGEQRVLERYSGEKLEQREPP